VFIKIADAHLLDKFEKMFNEERGKIFEKEIMPMTMKQYEQRIDSAMDDFTNRCVISARKLKKEISTWK
jgi:hypothetical protein